jgi:hypothetical protein
MRSCQKVRASAQDQGPLDYLRMITLGILMLEIITRRRKLYYQKKKTLFQRKIVLSDFARWKKVLTLGWEGSEPVPSGLCNLERAQQSCPRLEPTHCAGINSAIGVAYYLANQSHVQVPREESWRYSNEGRIRRLMSLSNRPPA